MGRLPHGKIITEDVLARAQRHAAPPGGRAEAVSAVAAGEGQPFDFLFPTLQEDPTNLLPQSPETVKHLKALAATMEDPDLPGADHDAPIPAAYTYFGQFVDHDITFEVQPGDLPPSASGDMAHLLAEDMAPLPPAEIRNALRNFRTGTLDLDSLYGLPAPRDPANGAKMRLGQVVTLPPPQQKPFLRPPGKTDDNDLPREPRSRDILHDRAALIGDPRNDENLIVGQLHLAFLKAHNRLVDEVGTFEQARRVLRQHYQYLVLADFLPRVADPGIVEQVRTSGNRWYDPDAGTLFMPLEFAVAAYRFGHTMVRAAYNFNLNFNLRPGGVPASLELLFTFTALSGQLGDFDTLPENWIIEWENVVGADAGTSRARRLDTQLAAIGDKALFNLQTLDGQPEAGLAAMLSARNLLRGYRLRLPTGQAVAGHLGLPVLSPEQLRAAAANPQQEQALQDGGFLERTPLWFYLLAEAAHGGGARLGPVGSTIVAEVLTGLIRRSEDSILRTPGWAPSLPAAVPGHFELADLLRFAGVLPDGAPSGVPGWSASRHDGERRG